LAVDVVGAIASIVLGLVFLVAGGSKIAAGPDWPVQAVGLGAPRGVIPFVPWVEIVVGAALVVQVARRPAALVALAILLVFTTLLATRLSEGKRPPCACFGAWSAKPLGPGHLARNAALIAVAGLALM
jgi:uncharacterized membrane protein YphA (DoxX/SURF4 family)|tara:strand:+ start:365 stop:748 length:384 start_codon:yes stop_codon:yes gene_type:complete